MILLTGATGRVAGAAGDVLAAAGVSFRAFVRDAEKYRLADHDNVEVVVGDLANPDDVRRALNGISQALLVTANGEQQANLEKLFANEAAEAGVSHIVKISSMEASPTVTAAFPKLHYESEEFIKSLGVNWTMIRPNFFMQNLLLFAQGIAKANAFALPLGNAKTGMLDARDVGRVCASILQTSGHENKMYQVTGSELIDFREVAARMSAVLGKEIRYVDQSPEEFRAFLSQFIKSEWHLNGVCGLFGEIANHSLEHVTTTVQDLTGIAPISLEEFVKQFENAFK